MRYLFLIDTKFPFRAGESFLENEIAELSDAFDMVHVFPIDTVIGEKPTRSVPQNVMVHLTEKMIDMKFRKIESLTRGLLFSGFGNNYLKRFKDKIFESQAELISKRIIDIIKQLEISSSDEIIIYSYWLYMPARVACNLKMYFRKKGIEAKALSRAHGFDIYETKENYLPEREILLRELDAVFACSNNGAEYISSRYPSYRKKIFTSLLGTLDHGMGKAETDQRKDVFEIFSCSRVIKLKRVELISKAVQTASAKAGITIHWTHIGDGPELKRIRALQHQPNMNDLLGYLPNTDVYQYYVQHHIDLFINASSSEGLPVSIMEAMSFGVPILATDVGGTSEIVQDGVNGILVDRDVSVEQLAEKIMTFINFSTTQIEEYRNNSRIIWEKNLNAKANYKRFVDRIIKL